MKTYGTALGDFLKARRDACQPESVGLAREHGRRVPGLRRDEVARLAGMSSEYYMRLEQGRVDTPSRQVVDAIARAMRLSSITTDYLYRLAGIGLPRTTDIPKATSDTLNAVLHRWRHTPAYLADRNLDILAANELMTAVTQGDIEPGMNALELTFTDGIKDKLGDWERIARETVSAFRYLGDETAPRHRQLVASMRSNPDFARFWDLREVSLPLGYEVRATIEGLGDLCVDVQNFTIPDLQGYTVTLYTAAAGSFTEQVLRDLAASLEVAA
ncbi:helix-turn-helix transcriptional regulator [Microbacterium sp. 1P10UB]|uniref:helix-turn-helix transcriptional regulator n=1 Tax=unclassified Microbacterium TaxID=2609290 RepID=UPI0039A3D212